MKKGMMKVEIIPHKDRRRIFKKKVKGYKEVDAFLFKTIKKAILPEMLLVLVTLAGCIITESYFLISCCVYNVVNGLARLILLYRPPVNKENGWGILNQKVYNRCIAANILLLITSLYLLGVSGFMFFTVANIFDIRIGIFLLVLSVIHQLFAFYYIVKLKNYTGIFIKAYRFMIYANAFVTALLFIGTILTVFQERAEADLVGLTGIVLGGCAAGLTGYILWIILLTKEKNKKLYQHMRNNSTIIFTRLSLKKDIIFVFAKIVLSCITLSGFMFANALYSAGMGIARFCAVCAQKKNEQKQVQSYFHIGAAILGASLCYVVYSLKNFSAGTLIRFDMNIALVIALYTFTEFGLITKDYIKARKSKNIISEEIKLIGLSSTFICLALTQVAIMSFTTESDNTVTNMLSGVFFGGMSALTGIYMMIRSRHLKKSCQEEFFGG